MTSGFLCKLYKRGQRKKKNTKRGSDYTCGKNTKLSPIKTVKTLEKQSYTRSYPQYTQKKTTSVVQDKGCQVRKFVLGFVIKSQKKGKNQMFSRDTTFLDKYGKINDLAVNTGIERKEIYYWNNEKNKRTIIFIFIKLYLLFWRFCAIIYSRGRREKELLHFCKAEPKTEKGAGIYELYSKRKEH